MHMGHFKTIAALILIMTGPVLNARDVLFMNQIAISAHDTQVSEIGFGLPPIGQSSLLWMNGFSLQYWSDTNAEYNHLRWSPSLIYRLNNDNSLFIANPHSFASDSSSTQFAEASVFSSFLFTINKKALDNNRLNWSYGLILLDRANRNRIFPVAGFTYLSEDRNFRYSIGFPSLSISYLGQKDAEFSFYYSRENTKFNLSESIKNFGSSRYLEQNLNILGLSCKISIFEIYRLTLKYGLSFSSQYHILDSNFEKVSDANDYSKQSLLSLGISLDFGSIKN